MWALIHVTHRCRFVSVVNKFFLNLEQAIAELSLHLTPSDLLIGKIGYRLRPSLTDELNYYPAFVIIEFPQNLRSPSKREEFQSYAETILAQGAQFIV